MSKYIYNANRSHLCRVNVKCFKTYVFNFLWRLIYSVHCYVLSWIHLEDSELWRAEDDERDHTDLSHVMGGWQEMRAGVPGA